MQKKFERNEKILDSEENIIAIIVDTNLTNYEKEFHTDHKQSFQIGTFNLPKGEELERHIHLENKRIISNTCETLIILDGKMTVDIYDMNKNFICTKNLSKGALISFFEGGHKFKIEKTCKFIEVKQGPYIEGLDKEKF
tara:strand:- start:4502 stop:4918 length:417 start_codon:yes stop_codon:yes gene_type:complete